MNAMQVFQTLPGVWKFSRQILPHGTMQGTASFSRIPNEDNALFYREEGVFLKDGVSYPCFKEYVYRYADSLITIYSHENLRRIYTESDSKVGNRQRGALNLSSMKQPNLQGWEMQSNLKLSGCPTTPEPIFESRAVYHQLRWDAGICEAEHMCNLDQYHGKYDFRRMVHELEWSITCSVRGPQKDYTIYTQFTRDGK